MYANDDLQLSWKVNSFGHFSFLVKKKLSLSLFLARRLFLALKCFPLGSRIARDLLNHGNILVNAHNAEPFDVRLDKFKNKLFMLNVCRVERQTNRDGIKRMENHITALLWLVLSDEKEESETLL